MSKRCFMAMGRTERRTADAFVIAGMNALKVYIIFDIHVTQHTVDV